MVQPARVLNGPTQQGRQRHQLINIFPLAGLGIKMQQSRRLHVKKLQNPLLVPRHHPVIHALQQTVHLVKMAIRLGQQAISEQRVADFPGDSQGQGEVRRSLFFRQAAQGNGTEQTPVVIKHRRGAKRPSVQRMFKMLLARRFDRLPEHGGQRKRAAADNAFRAVAAVTKSQRRKLVEGLRIAAAAENTGGLI